MKRQSCLIILVLFTALSVLAFKGIEPFPRAGGGHAMVEQREAQYQQEQMDRRQHEMDLRMRQQESDRVMRDLQESGRRNERLHKGFSFDD